MNEQPNPENTGDDQVDIKECYIRERDNTLYLSSSSLILVLVSLWILFSALFTCRYSLLEGLIINAIFISSTSVLISIARSCAKCALILRSKLHPGTTDSIPDTIFFKVVNVIGIVRRVRVVNQTASQEPKSASVDEMEELRRKREENVKNRRGGHE